MTIRHRQNKSGQLSLVSLEASAREGTRETGQRMTAGIGGIGGVSSVLDGRRIISFVVLVV